MNIFITGTSRGIGETLAIEYLEKDNTVYGLSRSAAENLSEYSNYHHLIMDLKNFDNMMDKLKGFIGNRKEFDLVILNAGLLPEIKDLIDTSMNEISTVMRVNVWANKNIIDTLFKLQHKVQQIVAISSGASLSGERGWNAYAISKAALNMLISLYSEEIPETHFSSLAPGVINTGMQEYIYNLPEERSYPVMKKLKEMRENDEIPDPASAAKYLVEAIKQVKRYDSGDFVDIREMGLV